MTKEDFDSFAAKFELKLKEASVHIRWDDRTSRAVIDGRFCDTVEDMHNECIDTLERDMEELDFKIENIQRMLKPIREAKFLLCIKG